MHPVGNGYQLAVDLLATRLDCFAVTVGKFDTVNAPAATPMDTLGLVLGIAPWLAPTQRLCIASR